MYVLIADTTPHFKHEFTPRQTHRQRTSVSSIDNHEAAREIHTSIGVLYKHANRCWFIMLYFHDSLSNKNTDHNWEQQLNKMYQITQMKLE